MCVDVCWDNGPTSWRSTDNDMRSTNELVPLVDDQTPDRGDSVTRAPISQQTGQRQPVVVDIPISPCRAVSSPKHAGGHRREARRASDIA